MRTGGEGVRRHGLTNLLAPDDDNSLVTLFCNVRESSGAEHTAAVVKPGGNIKLIFTCPSP